MRAMVWSLWVVACTGKEEPAPPRLLDTGWFVDTASDTAEPGECVDRVERTIPRGGETAWYWRDRPVIYATTENPTAYDAWLVDDAGQRLDAALVWRDDGITADLVWDGVLQPSTTYTLWTRDCVATQSVEFTTSVLGTPLSSGAVDLVGTTWRLDLVGATWVEPGALGGLLAVYFNTPILLGVQYADGANIDLIGAPGTVDLLGRIYQDPFAPSWDFPVQDFSQQPYFEAEVSAIELAYKDGGTVVDIPVQDFRLYATIAPDGTFLGGAKLSGLADTRGMGVLLGSDEPAAICEFAQTIGVACVPCADNGPYCLRLVAEDLDGTRIDDLTLHSQ